MLLSARAEAWTRDELEENHFLLTSLLLLRKRGVIGPIMADEGRISICLDPAAVCPRDSAVYHSKEKIYDLLQEHGITTRPKPMGTSTNPNPNPDTNPMERTA